MTRFDLTDAQHELRALLHEALPAILPTARLAEVLDADTDDDPASWRCLTETGVLDLAVPAADGGAGEGVLTLAVAAEEAGYAGVPGGFLGHVLAVLALRGATGGRRATVALGQVLPDARRLTGTVPFVPGAHTADLVVVATTAGPSVVDTRAGGVRVAEVGGVDPTRRLGTLVLDDVAHEPLPGGPALTSRLVDAARVLLAADAHGGARRCLDLAVAHAREREQFGLPIGRFQAVRHQLADLATAIEPGRGLYWLAAMRLDDGDERARQAAALAKAHLSEVFLTAARECVRLHGALGYTWDGPVNPWVGRALFDHALHGTPPTLRAVVADGFGWG